MVDRFKKSFALFDDNAEIVDNLYAYQVESPKGTYWIAEAIENLNGLHLLAGEMIKHMEGEK